MARQPQHLKSKKTKVANKKKMADLQTGHQPNVDKINENTGG